ncbi:MAG: hypothetical protein EAX86_08040 [Candidatus Heimdallarchaeota archaeon]|nr:hypothetical protein [Candidatus Heimdallarchaeota archaeon]
MRIGLLTKLEIEEVTNTINKVAGLEIMENLLRTGILVKLSKQRQGVFLLDSGKQEIWEHLNSFLEKGEGEAVHVGLKLGFIISGKFRIGIESLAFLAPLISRKLILDENQTQKYIYGRNLIPSSENLRSQVIKLHQEYPVVMVFSQEGIPIGYARIIWKNRVFVIQNLVDIGIFLRSEKSAF